MPTKKGRSEFELNAVDCCALKSAMFENRDVEMMLLPLLRRKIRESFKSCRKRLSEVFGNRKKPEPYILNTSSEEGTVCKAYIEREMERFHDLVQGNKSLRLSCNHTVASHLKALTEIWELFPKEKEQ